MEDLLRVKWERVCVGKLRLGAELIKAVVE